MNKVPSITIYFVGDPAGVWGLKIKGYNLQSISSELHIKSPDTHILLSDAITKHSYLINPRNIAFITEATV